MMIVEIDAWRLFVLGGITGIMFSTFSIIVVDWVVSKVRRRGDS